MLLEGVTQHWPQTPSACTCSDSALPLERLRTCTPGGSDPAPASNPKCMYLLWFSSWPGARVPCRTWRRWRVWSAVRAWRAWAVPDRYRSSDNPKLLLCESARPWGSQLISTARSSTTSLHTLYCFILSHLHALITLSPCYRTFLPSAGWLLTAIKHYQTHLFLNTF